jgi:hypothetical protein
MEIRVFDQSLSHALEDWETHRHLMGPGIEKSVVLQVEAVDEEAAFLVKTDDGDETQKTFPSDNMQFKILTERIQGT